MQKARQFPLRVYIQNLDTLCYTIFHEMFVIGIHTQKSWYFALRNVFIYKKHDSLKKARQFALRFYIQKS